MESSYKSSLNIEILDIINRLSKGASLRDVDDALTKLSRILPTISLDETGFKMDLNPEQMDYRRYHCVRFLQFLLDQLNYNSLSVAGSWSLFDSFFTCGYLRNSFLVLNANIITTEPSAKLDKCISLLSQILTVDRLVIAFLIESLMSLKSYENDFQEELVTVFVSLPDRLANKLKKHNQELFYPSTYFKLIAEALLHTQYYLIKAMHNEQDVNLTFVSQLISRSCLQGHSDIILQCFLNHWASKIKTDFVWRRLIQHLVLNIPASSIESFLVGVIKHCPNSEIITLILGKSVLSNEKIKFLLTQKFILIRVFEDDRIVQNILGYLANDNSRHLLDEVLKTSLQVWGDKSTLKIMSESQHIYISKVLLLSTKLLGKDAMKWKEELLSLLMKGMSSHLQSPQESLRKIGMATAEGITKMLDKDGPQLSFSYDPDKNTKSLLKILDFSSTHGKELLVPKDIGDLELGKLSISNKKKENSPEISKKAAAVSEVKVEELDSDDDLEPYDISDDNVIPKVRRPCYLRDCLEGLIEQNNPDVVEASLHAAEHLIKSEVGLQEIAEEFAKVLLSLENQYSLHNFFTLRHKAMVALTVQCPIESAAYFTKEFYDRNYSIRQRLDILEVLSTAAQELVEPPTSSGKERHPPKISGSIPGTENWQAIVKKRMENKTRYFSRGPQRAPKPSFENKFGNVAGYFFFSLMKNYDCKENSFDLMEEDSVLMGRLLYTLGIVMYCAIHTPIAIQMGKSLMEFIWTLRYYPEAYVCQALMFALCMLILAVPSFILLSDLQKDIFECKFWLEDIAENDSDVGCKILAIQTLSLLEKTIKDELQIDSFNN